jgi:hypothetical protein
MSGIFVEMKNITSFILDLLILSLSYAANAEISRYVDKGEVSHFTTVAIQNEATFSFTEESDKILQSCIEGF